MAIQVSYLESKLYPSWVKTKAETVPVFKGNWKFPAIPTRLKSGLLDLPRGAGVPADTGQSYTDWPRIKPTPNMRGGFMPEERGAPVQADKGGYQDWPRLTATPNVRGGFLPEPAGTPVESFKGNFQYPARITPELVTSTPRGVKPESMRPGPKSPDGWAELSQIYFTIIIQGKPLGRWSKIDGLGVKLELAEHRTGDGDNYRWYEPTYTTFPNIKLTRASSNKGSAELLAWVTHTQFQWKRGMIATIAALPLWKNSSAVWSVNLQDVMPVNWTGPSFSSDGKVATETLELAHSGFIDPHGGAVAGVAPIPVGMAMTVDRAKFTPPPLPGPRTLKSLGDLGGSGKGAYGIEA
ncbi:MAG: phage tail protein [Actinomycetota bacterium]|nr:phage tail protein [Acidimicrobiia bacterium]MDQ3294488.1 phage tail protein [Actinomycetota bacterium]